MSQPFYKVYIACMTKNADGNTTKDCILARQLYRRLEQKGIHTFLTEKCNPDDRTEALDSALVLVVAGRSAASLMSDEVRNDYEDFIAGVELSGKRKWRVFNYLLGLQHDDLPGYLRNHRSYEHYRADDLVKKIEEVLSADDPRNCILEDADQREDSMPPAARELPECLPDCAESAREAGDSGDDEEDLPLRRRARARRAPQSFPEEKRTDHAAKQPSPEGAEGSNAAPLIPPVPSVPSMPSMPSMPSSPGKGTSQKPSQPVKVRPARFNKAEFSVVAPDEVRPGKSSVIDLLMYTRSQRAVVRRTIAQAKESSSEAARSSAGVSVKQGSRITARLFSDDMELTDSERTMIWNGDALDFKFRVTPPEDYAKKEIDFGCSVQFDGIEITRLYFTVAVGSKKKTAVRFTRKDCRRAFVSYSHKDRLRVVEQLLAIQEIAPKLRFWMDNRSMTAGDMWRSAIASAIRNADVFLLFWSVSAKESSEVRKEWEYALRLEQSDKTGAGRRRNGMRFISPVPLDSPADCPPPEELSDLHFGDPSFDSDIDNIEKVRVWAVRGRNIKYL